MYHLSGIIQTNLFIVTYMDRQIGLNNVPFWASLNASHGILFPLSNSFSSESKQVEAFYIILIKWKNF